MPILAWGIKRLSRNQSDFVDYHRFCETDLDPPSPIWITRRGRQVAVAQTGFGADRQAEIRLPINEILSAPIRERCERSRIYRPTYSNISIPRQNHDFTQRDERPTIRSLPMPLDVQSQVTRGSPSLHWILPAPL